MRTIGVSPVEALVIPRLISAVVMMPLLAFWSMLLTLIGGGMFVWLSLGIPPITYIQRLQEVIPLTDLWVGLIKAPVFGFIIALSGCFQGMLVQGDSEQVGTRTTIALEWTVPSPTGHGNFGEELPVVHRWAFDFGVPGGADDFIPQNVPSVEAVRAD